MLGVIVNCFLILALPVSIAMMTTNTSDECGEDLIKKVIQISHPGTETYKLFLELNRVATLRKDHRMPSPCYEWNCTHSDYRAHNLKCRWCLPYAIVPGMPKAGTSELFALLESHPKTRGWKEKEIDIFCRFKFRSLSDFEMKVSASLTSPNKNWWVDPYSYWIDGSAGCATSDDCLASLMHYSPDTKSVIVIRDPYQRLASMVCMGAIQHLNDTEMMDRNSEKFKNWLNNEAPKYVNWIDSGKTLRYISEMRRRDMLMVIDNYDLARNRKQTIKLLESFLDIPMFSSHVSKEPFGMNAFGAWGHRTKSDLSKGQFIYQYSNETYHRLKESYAEYLCQYKKLVGKDIHIVTPEPTFRSTKKVHSLRL